MRAPGDGMRRSEPRTAAYWWVLGLNAAGIGLVVVFSVIGPPRGAAFGAWSPVRSGVCVACLLLAECFFIKDAWANAVFFMVLVGVLTFPFGLPSMVAAAIACVLQLRSKPGVPNGPRCAKCGYSLVGLTVPRCPECGCLIGFDRTLNELGLTEEELRRYAEERAQRDQAFRSKSD
jgi:hypothetical protein